MSDTERSGEGKPKRGDLSRAPKQKSKYQKLGRGLLMLFRRVHLYSGLFMFPWVLLYGFTGWFFNHPRVLTGGQVVNYQSHDVLNGDFAKLPSAEQTAVSVVDAMNETSRKNGGPRVTLLPTRTPAFRDHIQFTVPMDGGRHEIRVNPATGDGQIRTILLDGKAKTAAIKNPLQGVPNEPVKPTALTEVTKQIPALLKDLGLESRSNVRRMGQLRVDFLVEADGVPCLVTYNLANGSIASVVNQHRPAIEPKRLMERMHLTHTYTPTHDARWFWALVVDAMFVSMVFWAISGLLMWWQVKRTRLWGVGVLALSVLTTVAIIYGVHDSLTTPLPKIDSVARSNQRSSSP